MTVQERMRALREDHDLTQEQVARYLGTSQTMYARYERGANELPLRHLVALCRLYHVSADYLLGLSRERTLDVSGLSEEEAETVAALVQLLQKKTR